MKFSHFAKFTHKNRKSISRQNFHKKSNNILPNTCNLLLCIMLWRLRLMMWSVMMKICLSILFYLWQIGFFITERLLSMPSIRWHWLLSDFNTTFSLIYWTKLIKINKIKLEIVFRKLLCNYFNLVKWIELKTLSFLYVYCGIKLF